MDQAVNEYAFSDLYTYVAHVTGLPRREVKEAILAKFYGMDDHPTWVKIVTILRTNAKAEQGDDE